ncbi:Cyclin domain-containing protein [Mucor velutinosus]|uniref:Cyclin domain-containing protein n=1 Tax=Mucor velutinosus TaxID=708070 RepID=A0AAN7D302_9FUNG|nr:Cyclin domain-containing protein [Mucor velutinosus]
MKLSFSLALLVSAAISVQAAATPVKASGTCISGSSGKGNGDGYYGYCCQSSDDCWESCKSGVCNGPALSSQTSAPPLSTETLGPCLPGAKGKRNGDGYLGYCCSSSDDCVESCKSGVCNGPRKPNDPPAGLACRAGYAGLNNGQGPATACCYSSDDCKESCVNGRCN